MDKRSKPKYLTANPKWRNEYVHCILFKTPNVLPLHINQVHQQEE